MESFDGVMPEGRRKCGISEIKPSLGQELSARLEGTISKWTARSVATVKSRERITVVGAALILDDGMRHLLAS